MREVEDATDLCYLYGYYGKGAALDLVSTRL